MVRRFRKARKFVKLLRHRRWLSGMLRGVAAAVEHQANPIPRDLATVIDVGAHRGQFALFIREHAPSAMLHCFEPLEEPLRVLEKLFATDPQVHVYPYAAGAAAGTAAMHVSARDDASSLLSIAPAQVRQFPGTGEMGREVVSVVCLDEFLNFATVAPPVLLKLDVQGSELAILKGASRLLHITTYVLAECSFVEFYEDQPLFPEVYRFLEDRGFQFAGASCSARDRTGTWLQADVLFRSIR